MARISIRPVEGVNPSELAQGDAAGLDVGGILQHRPESNRALQNLARVMKDTGTLGARLTELVRIRISFHNQCRNCMAIRHADAIDEGVTDELVCSLERPAEAPDLTDAERAALRYADLFATDHLAIDDAVYDSLRDHFDEGQIVELGLYCAIAVGTGRLSATWHAVDSLPERFQADGIITPWGGEQLVAQGFDAGRPRGN